MVRDFYRTALLYWTGRDRSGRRAATSPGVSADVSGTGPHLPFAGGRSAPVGWRQWRQWRQWRLPNTGPQPPRSLGRINRGDRSGR